MEYKSMPRRVVKWLAVALLVAGGGAGIRSLWPKAKTAWFLWQENARLSREVERLERETQAHARALEELGVERLIEQEARLRLQFRKPGEAVVIVPPKDAAPTPSPAPVLPGARGEVWHLFVDWLTRFVQ